MTRFSRLFSTDLIKLSLAGSFLVVLSYLTYQLGTGSSLLFLVGFVLCFAVYLGAVLLAKRPECSSRHGLLVILLVTICCRLPQLPASPFLDDDIYRYLWDGKVSAEGINPYQYAPDDPHLFYLRGELHQQVRFRQIHTVYPPVSQCLFWLSWQFSLPPLLVWKLVLFFFELATLLSLFFSASSVGCVS